MSCDGGRKRGEGYPPEYRQYVQETVTATRRNLLISGSVFGFFAWGYFRDWTPGLLFDLAPLTALVFLILLLGVPGTIDSICVVRILPYFQKSHPGVSGGCSFLSGQALARNCVFLDALALEIGLEPFSTFGFADDLEWGGGPVIWHKPERGLETISGLRAALRRNPSRLAEKESVIAELSLMEANLCDAVRLQAPFCLLLRYGSSASGHEMDVRRGYFCFSDHATLLPEECQRQ